MPPPRMPPPPLPPPPLPPLPPPTLNPIFITPTEDYNNDSPSASITESRETNHDKMLVNAILRASTTIDIEAIKDILRQTTDSNKFPITTAYTGDKTTYKLRSVGYGILNGAITPTGNTVSPAFTRACKKQWIINCLNGNEIIGLYQRQR